ncbi:MULTISPECIES: ATP-binding protein [Niallia]|uniref:AAA family ATPase n=1 Tax=Niallia alba TaxID=2729105 RepID=A0A7Y0PLR8_9BACI|nr:MULTISPECIES: ATP-binding protein [Niallia]NMO75694.1 AAA family ATPase [Niallia alba]UTI43491.1 ATP-binding protein [Niallia sp. RD1]
MNRVIIPNGCNAIEADYSEQVIEEYRKNPFIEALPSILSTEEAIEKMAIYAEYNSKERMLDKQYRIHLVQRLFQCFQPLWIHLDLESRISRVIRQGYLARNPFRAGYAQSLQEGHRNINGLNNELSNNSVFRTTAAGFTIIGVSGMGKTTAINRILSLYPQVIVHKDYNEIKFSMYQLVWLKLDCPFDSSLRGLALEFFRKVDDLLGTEYHKKFGLGRKTINDMLVIMSQIARNTGLGVLIIDEIQHLSKAKSGGDQKMLNFFVTLVNTIGVPVILVGTPAGLSILQSEFRQARRGSGQGDMIWDRLKNNQNWDLLINALWGYQWTKKQIPLTDDFKNILYEESQGIIDIAVKLYVMAQIEAIMTQREEITPESISQVANKHLQLVKPMIQALKSGNISKIAKFEDISTVDVDFLGFMERERATVDLQMKMEAMKRTQRKKEQEMSISIKEKAILKLLELDFEPNEVQKVVEAIVEKEGNLDINELVVKAIQEMSTSNKRKKKRKEEESSVENDIRHLVIEGRKENKTAYEVLCNGGFIKSHESDFGQTG